MGAGGAWRWRLRSTSQSRPFLPNAKEFRFAAKDIDGVALRVLRQQRARPLHGLGVRLTGDGFDLWRVMASTAEKEGVGFQHGGSLAAPSSSGALIQIKSCERAASAWPGPGFGFFGSEVPILSCRVNAAR